jgi:hypothetical protein
MESINSQQPQSCLSLADGYLDECSLVREHNASIGAEEEEVVEVPAELTGEFAKLSSSLMTLSRAYELGLVDQ